MQIMDIELLKPISLQILPHMQPNYGILMRAENNLFHNKGKGKVWGIHWATHGKCSYPFHWHLGRTKGKCVTSQLPISAFLKENEQLGADSP